MMPRAAIFAILTLAPGGLRGDDLPPGVLLLSKIKRHIREEVGRLPDYTCLQTTARSRKQQGGKRPAEPSDTVMLEVLYTGEKELYGSPGTRRFANEDPSSFTGGGMSGNGMFALHLRPLFVNDNGMSQYRGEEELAGR